MAWGPGAARREWRRAGALSRSRPIQGKKIKFGFGTDQRSVRDRYSTATRRGTRFQLNGSARAVFVPMLGRHSACNALAAIAVGTALGVPQEEIIEGLAHRAWAGDAASVAEPGHDHRPQRRLQCESQLDAGRDRDDADPSPTEGRRIAVLGDMRELGDPASDIIARSANLPRRAGIDLMVCVGEQAAIYC